MKNVLGVLVVVCLWCACQPKPKTAATPAAEDLQHQCVQDLTDVIVHDIISPPVASRMYAYSSLAFYEALRPAYKSASSITESMHGFDNMPGTQDGAAYDFPLAAATAFYTVAEGLVFSKDSIRTKMRELMNGYKDADEAVVNRSVDFGKAVAGKILQRAANDNYKLTRGMPRYSVFKEEGKWQQTPPDYADATEPHWRLIKPLRMDSAAQCRPTAPPAYSMDKSSVYYKELEEVYHTSKAITPQQDSIAIYWDDNPFVVVHKGHLAFANKKTTPVGHWMGIVGILCRQYAKGDALKTAKAYALTASAIFDGFISCWDEKYRSRTVRPVTVIREVFDPVWEPLLQTPPFPEYTSGHSVISSAAAVVLHRMFGELPFTDTTEMPYLGMQRRFASVMAAADEAGISRLYGGIHFRAAIVEGKKQGEQVGSLFANLMP